MDIGFIDKKNTDRIKEIWRYCFSDTEDFIDLYFNKKFKPENTLAVYTDGSITSNLQMIPYKLKFRNTPIDISYIVGVASMPEVRSNNHVKLLLKKSIQVMKDKEHLISILMPFKYQFYKKFGWETCYYYKNYNLKMSDIKNIAIRYGKMYPLNFERDLDGIMQVYSEFCTDKNGVILRTKNDWSCIFKDHTQSGGRSYILTDKSGNIKGYIFYNIKDNTFSIHEMGYSTTKAFLGLFWFIYSHSAQAENIIYKAPFDDLTYLHLTDTKGTVSIVPFIMARINDCLGVLKLLLKITPTSIKLSLYIEDDFASFNSGTYCIESKTVQKKKGMPADISMNINTFTRLAMGAISIFEALKAGLIEVNNKAALESAAELFKPAANFINDYY